MFRLALVLSILAAGVGPREVLIGTSVTAISRTQFTHAIDIQNLGPNPIYCAVGDTSSLTVDNGHEIASGDDWAMTIDWRVKVACIASTAQVAGSGTRVTELP